MISSPKSGVQPPGNDFSGFLVQGFYKRVIPIPKSGVQPFVNDSSSCYFSLNSACT